VIKSPVSKFYITGKKMLFELVPASLVLWEWLFISVSYTVYKNAVLCNQILSLSILLILTVRMRQKRQIN